MATADVTVMGGGIFGLASAYACARRGARVRLIELHRLGAASSGGPVGALAPHVPEAWNPKKQFQLEALLDAPRFWAEVALHSGRDPGYAREGRLQPLASGLEVARAEARAESAALLWPDGVRWQVRPAAEFGDWAPVSASGWLVHDTLSARLNPGQALAALASALEALGGEVVIGEGVVEGAVIWATGAAGLGDLSVALAQPVGGAVKGQAALLAYDARGLPQLFCDGLHVVPHGDGTVAIGSTSERDWAAPEATDAQLDALIDRARLALPVLADAPVVRRWAGLRPRARSRTPMLGQWPGRPGHFIANGGFKIGFGMAPKVGEAMADLVLEGRVSFPDGFRVEASLGASGGDI